MACAIDFSKMLKTIATAELRTGMFVHSLNCSWIDHPFMRNQFLVTSDEEIQKIRTASIRDLVIDVSRGRDTSAGEPVAETRARIEQEVQQAVQRPAAPARTSLESELRRATQVRNEAAGMVRSVMADVRLGKAVEVDAVQPVVQNITESILRNPGALLGLVRIRGKDSYTFMHSVSVCALMVAFCTSRKLSPELTREAGLGGLLHDAGKALVPDAILNKPGKLTEEEFDVIRRHPRDGWEILRQSAEVPQTALDITLHHHERYDGSGYPDKLAGDQISELAQMTAIVDVYDAITADRCYHQGMAAPAALRKMYEWSKAHFAPGLVQDFMRCVGIYPVGSLVLLESGRLGVVVEQNEASLLTPRVNVFFNTKKNVYIKPEQLDLSKKLGFGGGDRITGYEAPEKWKVDPARFLILPA